MMPHLETLLNMHEKNEVSMNDIVSYVIKYIAEKGTKEDYISLPVEVKEEVLKKIEWYKEKRSWFIVSNLGTEDYKNYAEEFLKKIEAE